MFRPCPSASSFVVLLLCGPLLCGVVWRGVVLQRELLSAPPGTVATAQPNWYFSVEDAGGGPSLDLCPGGRSRVVTDANKFEYVDLVTQHFLGKDVEERLGVRAIPGHRSELGLDPPCHSSPRGDS